MFNDKNIHDIGVSWITHFRNGHKHTIIPSIGDISPAMTQNPFSPFLIPFTTSLTPLLTIFAWQAFLTNLWILLVVFFGAMGWAITDTYLIFSSYPPLSSFSSSAIYISIWIWKMSLLHSSSTIEALAQEYQTWSWLRFFAITTAHVGKTSCVELRVRALAFVRGEELPFCFLGCEVIQ